MWAYVAVVTVPFLVSWTLTPWVGRWALRRNLVDRPGGRRHHPHPTPRAGGIALVAAFLVGIGLPLLFPSHFPPIADPNQPIWLRGLILGTLIAALGGLWDDKVDLPPTGQFLIQLLCALAAIWSTLFIERINNPLTNTQVIFPRPLVWALTIFWVMGMMNTVNWLDGVDGLAASVAAVFSLVLVVHLIARRLNSVALWPLALLGAILGFLPYNWPPARLFLGSTGAYSLGFIMAALGIAAGAKIATVLLVLALPIVDVAWQIVRRWQAGKSPFAGDRGHLHLRLYDVGWSPRRIILFYLTWESVMGALALFTSSRRLKLVLLPLVLLAALLTVLWATRQTGGQGEDCG